MRGKLEIVPDGEVGEDAAALLHDGDAAVGELAGGEGGDVLAFEDDLAATDGYHVHDGLTEGGFAGTVETDDAHSFALLHFHGNAAKYVDAFLIAAPEVVYL